MKILISSDPKSLRTAKPCITVEAEYGSTLVEGSILTLAHHGDRGGNEPPSMRPNGIVAGAETIGISHVDLDTLGGILSVQGTKPGEASFWALSGFVDVNGPHRVSEAGASAADLARIQAYWAGASDVYPERDGSVSDVSDKLAALAVILAECLADNPARLQAGREEQAALADLNASSFRKLLPGGVILRESVGAFVNMLYTTPTGEVGRACVTHNPSEDVPNGAITASLAMPVEGVHVGNLLGEFFSPECGGHAGIGGTERGNARPVEDARRFASLLADKLG